MEVDEPLDGLNSEELRSMEKKLGDLVATYSTLITRIHPNDKRDPPGEAHGTGTFYKDGKHKYLLTCDHVSRTVKSEKLIVSFHSSEIFITLENPFSALEYPADVAITAISEPTWNMVEHQAKCIPIESFSSQHSPVENELMYISGYPGELSRIWPAMPPTEDGAESEPGIQACTAISIMTQIQKDFDPTLDLETPQPLEDMHFLLPYSPEHAIHMSSDQDKVLPRAPGLSGSLVWNTRYREITATGGVWQPEDARVTGIVWGNSTKAGVLVATPVEYIAKLIKLARNNISTGVPYWKGPERGVL